MKAKIIGITLLSLLVISIYTSSYYKSIFDIKVDANGMTEDYKDVVEDFWNASKNGNNDEVTNLITKSPSNIFVKCKDSGLEKKDNLNTEPVNINTGQTIGISNEFINNNYEELKKLSSAISSKNYKMKIVESRNSKNTALVVTKFGINDFSPYTGIFLLLKEEKKWKIFMVTNTSQLNLFNQNFAVDCQ